MVKLQKRFAYKYKDKDHFKHVVTIPEDYVHELGWREGDELNLNIGSNKLTLIRAKKMEEE